MEQPTSRRTRRRKQRRNKKMLLAAVAAAAVVVIAVAAVLLGGTGGQNDQPNTPPEITYEPVETATPTATVKLEIDPNAGELITPTPAPQEPGVAIPGWGSMTIPVGAREVQTSMQNPEANEGWYYLTFELRLKDTNEVLFTTGLIPPGQYCNQVTLARPLEAGEYDAIVHVQPYRMSDLSPTNNADMETVLIVK